MLSHHVSHTLHTPIGDEPGAIATSMLPVIFLRGCDTPCCRRVHGMAYPSLGPIQGFVAMLLFLWGCGTPCCREGWAPLGSLASSVPFVCWLALVAVPSCSISGDFHSLILSSLWLSFSLAGAHWGQFTLDAFFAVSHGRGVTKGRRLFSEWMIS